MQVTSTFKQQKVQLVKEGFDPNTVKEPLYFQDISKKTYVPVDINLFQDISTGNVRL